MDGIVIVHEASWDEPFFVVDKPSGLPSAPLREGEDSALTRLVARFPELAGVRGRKEVECGLVHRLDTATSGLLLVAARQDFYDRIIAEQDAGRFVKSYAAECDVIISAPPCEGFPSRPQQAAVGNWLASGGPASGGDGLELTVTSRFRPWGPHGREVRPVAEDSRLGARKKAAPGFYQTELSLSLRDRAGCHACCRIRRGYRHQVRCHLAWLGFPVRGDRLYNSAAGESDAFCFRATGLEFLGLSFALN